MSSTSTRPESSVIHSPASTRNVVLIGHTAAGKTTLVEALLLATGAINRSGTVAEGTTVSDHRPIEYRLGRSVALSIATTTFRDGDHGTVQLTLLDTPGHPDFVGEVRAGLRAADAALFVVSAVDGVDGSTRMLWEECAAVGMPRAVVLTHVDSERADVEAAVAICQRVFGEGVQPCHLPVYAAEGSHVLAGLFDVIAGELSDYTGERSVTEPPQRQQADAEQIEATEAERTALVEGIITESEDDTLLERWVGGELISPEVLTVDLERAVARGSFFPVLPVAAGTGVGVFELLWLLARGFPSPLEHPMPMVTSPEGAPLDPVTCAADGPLLAEVVKTTWDPYVGRVSVVRVFCGTLRPDAELHISGHGARFADAHHRAAAAHPEHDDDERGGLISRILGSALTPIDQAVAGEIVAVARLVHAETGDTVSSPQHPMLMEPWVMPEPLLPTAVTAHSATDEDKLALGLARIASEDPSARIEVDPNTHQQVIWTMGEAHLDVLLDVLRSRHHVEVTTEPVRVALRETVVAAGSGHGRHVKQSGGHGQFAVCDVEVEPLPRGAGVEFTERVVGGAVPKQYFASVEKGVRRQLSSGVVAGYPMVDVRVTLTGGKAHSVDSSDAAFAMAGALAVKEAAVAAGIQLLEPVDAVVVTADDEYVGAVMGDLSARRGRVTGSTSLEGGRTQIDAEVPASELTRYATELRSVAHGTGTLERSYLHHAPVPPGVASTILEAATH